MERWPNYKLYPPRKFPFKRYSVLALMGFAYLYYERETNRYAFMAQLRQRNRIKMEQAQQINESFSMNIKDFKGQDITLDDANYEYKFIYYGDFQTFFQLYAEELENLPEYRIKNIYLTDSARTKDIMANVMKVQLKNTWYAFEEDPDIIKDSGLIKDNLFCLNGNNDVIATLEVTPQNATATKNVIQSVKRRIRKDIDKQFLTKFDFATSSASNTNA